MKLYFSPLACSIATRIALYEAGAPVELIEVDGKTKTSEDGSNFLQVHPLGLVPVLVTDGGETITESSAILQFVASQFPEARLAPSAGLARARLQSWLSFVATELHKATYVPLLDEKAPEAAKSYALAHADTRLDWLASQLDGREFLLDEFSVADAYLFAVLNWSVVTPIDLARWPALSAYMARVQQRPSVKRALDEEKLLYIRELSRQRARDAAEPRETGAQAAQ
ncbi:MAG TPA: glutathione S-transferase N-terminal domain-containing protein [Polyangiaceae bacterium]